MGKGIGRLRERLVLVTLVGLVAILSATSTVLYIEASAPRTLRIMTTHWSAIWSTNDSPATFPLGPGDWAGSCWNLTGSRLPSTELTCDLQFDSGTFGPTPANQHWSSLNNLTIAAPLILAHGPAVGYFGLGLFLSSLVLWIQFPSSPGTYDFSGVLWVS
ncbi:MAG: hypothetical protein L3K06_05030 [Thermoplasmata archaeon]|nr:hypothetical protein [Thermoplasmata archaeon]